MSENIEKTADIFKELDDTELEIVFIEKIYKKLKEADNKHELRTAPALLLCMSIVDTLKKYSELAAENNRTIPHEDIFNMLLNKGESFLVLVANDESKAPYISQRLNELRSWSKELLYILKKDLTNKPEYNHLKKE